MARPLSASQLQIFTSSLSTPKRDGIPTFARRVSCSASSCLPALPGTFGLDLLFTGLRIPQALRYVEGFFFSQAKPESGRRGHFLPITQA
jgi:hypothetical protein